MKTKQPGKGRTKRLDDDQKTFRKIGKRIKQLRIDAGYTNAEKFAFEHEITRSQYANWEKGQDMLTSSILRIARAHGITLQEFFAGIE
jgi:transcriptional regulator with XRE-family HTH domain